MYIYIYINREREREREGRESKMDEFFRKQIARHL